MLTFAAMTKSDAKNFLNVPNLAGVARVLEISKQAVYQWPDQLPTRTIDEIVGAGVRIGLYELTPRQDRAA